MQGLKKAATKVAKFRVMQKVLPLPRFFVPTITHQTTMEQQPQQKTNNLSIEISEEMARGKYANFAIISHSPSEFILDFACVLPAMPKAPVQSRIVLAPEHAKRLASALQDNIAKYESTHGEIKLTGGAGMPPIPMTFGGQPAQA
jgi:hypothetical protein